MQTLMNKVQLIGNLGMDPELKRLDGNKVMVKLALATNEHYKDKDGKPVQQTYWHNLIAWGSSANYAVTNLRKGTFVAVRGKLRHRQVEDKDGSTRYFTDVVVDQFVQLAEPAHSTNR